MLTSEEALGLSARARRRHFDDAADVELEVLDADDADADDSPTTTATPRRAPEKSMSSPAADKVHTDTPIQHIQELIQLQPETNVKVQIKRSIMGNKWAGVRACYMPPRALFDLNGAIRHLVGGGTFLIEVSDPANGNRLLPKWWESVDGPLAMPDKDANIIYDVQSGKLVVGREQVAVSPYAPPAHLPQGYGAPPPGAPMYPSAPGAQQPQSPPAPRPTYDMRGQLQPVPPALLDQLGIPKYYSTSFQPQQQWDLVQRTWDERYGGTEAIAMHMARSAEHRESDARVSAAGMSARFEAMQHQLTLLERENARLQADKENNALKVQLAGIEARLAAGPAVAGPSIDWTGLATALSPVAVALIGRPDAGDAAMTEVLKAAVSKPERDTMAPIVAALAAIAPIAGPAIAQWLQNQSPAQIAELRESQGMQQQLMLKMMMDFIVATQPQGEEPIPWWQQAIMGAIQEMGAGARMGALRAGMGGGALPSGDAQHFMPQQTQQHQQHVRQPQHASQAQVAQAQQAAPPQGLVPPQIAHVLQDFEQSDPEAAEKTAMVFQMLARNGGHPAFFTHEWVTIIFNVHCKLDVDELVGLTVDYLEHSRTFRLLPEPLYPVFTQPREVLTPVFQSLPIYLAGTPADREYVEALLEASVEEIESRERERRLALEEDDDADDSELEDDDEAPPEVLAD